MNLEDNMVRDKPDNTGQALYGSHSGAGRRTVVGNQPAAGGRKEQEVLGVSAVSLLKFWKGVRVMVAQYCKCN